VTQALLIESRLIIAALALLCARQRDVATIAMAARTTWWRAHVPLLLWSAQSLYQENQEALETLSRRVERFQRDCAAVGLTVGLGGVA